MYIYIFLEKKEQKCSFQSENVNINTSLVYKNSLKKYDAITFVNKITFRI